MKHLREQEWLTLVSAIDELHSDFAPQTLQERTLSAASKVVAADSVAFTGISYDGKYEGLYWENAGNISPSDADVFARYLHENPLVNAFLVEHRTETLKITDLISPAKFQRTNVFNEFYRRVGVRNQLVAPLLISKSFFMSCSVNTSKDDFTEQDKLSLTLLAPHLVNAVRNAFAYERLTSALETENCGIIAVNAEGEPLFVSEFSRQLFDRYFADEKRGAESLPESLSGWLKRVDAAAETTDFSLPPQPLKIESSRGVLTIRRMYNSVTKERTLLLEEKRFVDAAGFEKLGLTKREAEVLLWMTQGKTDDCIATLCDISVRTVHKHAEHIYIKLGVETRTGAMLKALEIR